MKYQTDLYERYLSTQVEQTARMGLDRLKEQLPVYRHYFKRYLPARREARIVDIGCGHGGFLYYLSESGYSQVVGVDISPEQVAAARAFGGQVSCEDAASFLSRTPGEFDCIIAIDLLEHIPKENVIPLLRTMHSALAPGGTAVFRTPNADGPFGARLRYSDFTHEFALTSVSARQLMANAGFTILCIMGVEPYVHGALSLMRFILWKAFKLAFKAYLGAEMGTRHGLFTQNMTIVAAKTA